MDILNNMLFHRHYKQGVNAWTSLTRCYSLDILNKVLFHGHLKKVLYHGHPV